MSELGVGLQKRTLTMSELGVGLQKITPIMSYARSWSTEKNSYNELSSELVYRKELLQ
jgi:hypothetical protein